MSGQLALDYKSGSQRARVVTEGWAEDNLYCPNCLSPKLNRLNHNNKVSDFACPNCKFWYQLKGQKTRFGKVICDGAYETMMEAILDDKTPNFYFLHYDLATWTIRNLILIPKFAFSASSIIKRKPLSETARRSGWVGCNIALNHIPMEARIHVVSESKTVPERQVREQFQRVKPLAEISHKERGWTLDVLTAIRTLGKAEFTNRDAYTLVPFLERLHPDNRHVRDKIRQQLQVLRDAALLYHVGTGKWRLPEPASPR